MKGLDFFYEARVCLTVLIALAFSHPAVAQVSENSAYEDLTHYSKVFQKEKYYRLYVPEGYERGDDRYPVVYFFHGWGGRHYKDPSAKLEYEMLKDLVDKYQVILAMWDGNYEEEQPRPYNMGYHENITSEIQMKDYFLELVAHIDSTYETLTDREHRGIIGFSMGGMMSWFLAGKYPHLVGAAVNMSGSPEFYIGHPDNHTLLPLRYAFKNLKDVRIRLHNPFDDELEYLNTEVHKGALWEGGLAYSYEKFPGGHMVDFPGETKVFETAMRYVGEAFRNPLPRSDRWWHYDFYSEFEVWDYDVKTNKKEPGFVVLKRVSDSGFGFTSARWLPDGPSFDILPATVTTAPVYKANTEYNVVKYAMKSADITTTTAQADDAGRLKLELEEDSEVGIFQEGDNPDLVVAAYHLEGNKRYLRAGEEHTLVLAILNRGGQTRKRDQVEVQLKPRDGVKFFARNSTATTRIRGERLAEVSYRVRADENPPSHAEPAWIKLDVTMKAGAHQFDDEVVVPVFFDVPALDGVKVDDGRTIRDKSYGTGNGDGVAAAGEAVLLYAGEHRLRLYTDDPYVVTASERAADEVVPSRWPDGFTLSSIVKIAEECPQGHVIEFLASYDSKDFETIERKVTWGKVFLTVGR